MLHNSDNNAEINPHVIHYLTKFFGLKESDILTLKVTSSTIIITFKENRKDSVDKFYSDIQDKKLPTTLIPYKNPIVILNTPTLLNFFKDKIINAVNSVNHPLTSISQSSLILFSDEKTNQHFCRISEQTSKEQLFELALKAKENNDIYRLSQCIFEIYQRCLPSWEAIEVESPNTKHVVFASFQSSPPSYSEIYTSSFFIKSLKACASELDTLLRNTDESFWVTFYKKYFHLARNDINSFFNLISYISSNMSELSIGCNEASTMKMVHVKSNEITNSRDNLYMIDKKNLVISF